MRFNKLEPKDKVYIEQVHADNTLSWDVRMNTLCSRFDVSERTIRRWVKKLGLNKKEQEDPKEYQAAKERKFDRTKKRFIITWCQNATPVHEPFLRNIETYAQHINASIHVIYGRYRNPTSIFTDSDYEWWDEAVYPYKDANRHNIHKHMSILSDIKVQPTAVNPLTGLEGVSGEDSCIIGHPKVHLKSLPVLKGCREKYLMTTGAVSIKNYTDSKAGKKGEFHHTFGFVVVELQDDDTFFVRQVTATDDGNFNDLFFRVEDQEVKMIDSCKALIMGDVHQKHLDYEVYRSTLDLTDRLEPEYIVLHDLFDGESISHHHLKDPIKLYHKHKEGGDLLRKEIDDLLDWTEDYMTYRPDSKFVVVRSNHDDFVDRWIMNQDWKKDIKNSLEYMEYAKVLLTGEAGKGIIPYILEKEFKDTGRLITLGQDDSFKLLDWELGAHGDAGQNGSRGSIRQFRKLNTKVIVGHYHAPGRLDGALAVGLTAKKRFDYQKGPDDNTNAHVILHHDGKAQHVLFMDNKYTTF